VKFLVLGPLEVVDDGAASAVRGRRERALLAALILNAGDVVSTDRLIDAVWRDRPPRSAAKTLQNQVLRLRKLLGSPVIETRVPGYRLVVDTGATDVQRFEDLVGLGRTARVNRTPDRAAVALRDALGLWRGPPFQELSGWEPAEAEAARLRELRCMATEELMDAELACGRHASCIAELEQLVAEEPFRERRWAMLMLALYRGGRQADALRTYQRARTTLAAELGLEPGPELRALERAVVSQDGSLDLPSEVPAPGVGSGTPPGDAGVVFILFSDIVASTEMHGRLGDEAADDLRRAHFQLLRAAVTTHAGREVKNVGDGLMVVFASGADAVSCAVEMQRAVAAHNRVEPEPLRMRIGLHVGEPLRDEGDFFGTPVVIAKRLCDAAAPGQIIASDLVRELVGPRKKFVFVDAGALGLKGLSEHVPAVEVLVDAAAPTDATAPCPTEPPYKGLVPFEAEDRELFFGRDALTAAVVERVAATRLLAVVGASGVGKSSLMRAGVVAALRDGALPGSPAWPTVLMTPGAHPLAELAAQVSLHAGASPGSLLDELRDDPGALDLAARQSAASSPHRSRFVLLVDQFEELFTLCRDDGERGQFVEAIVHATTVAGGMTTVVLAIRADFFGRCAEYPELARLVEAGTVLLSPMQPEELVAAVAGPARVTGLRLEPGLADVIVRDVAGAPGGLPLLSHALFETWKRRRGRVLTLSGYHDTGGVQGAIAATAETVFGRLDPPQQALARNVFVRLTELGDGADDTRRRVAVAELSVGPDDAANLESVLGRLTEARLVTISDAGVELAHEALIRAWPRLRAWLDDDREGLRIHRHLTRAAHDWEALGRDAAELYRGRRLLAALDWADRAGQPTLNPLELRFLAASRDRDERERREQQAQVRRLRRLLTGVGVALVIALVAGSLAVVQRRRADDEAQAARDATLRADVGRLVAESGVLLDHDRYLATVLALEAGRLADTAATHDALLNALAAEPRLRATMSAGHQDYVATVSIPPGRLVAARSYQALDFFDTQTGRLSGPSIELDAGSGLAASRDGSLVATGTEDGEVTLWNVATRERDGSALHVGHPARIPAFSADGKLLVTPAGQFGDTSPMGTAESVQAWDLATHRRVDLPLSGHTASVNAAAFSPDGRILATGGNDRTVVLHDAASGATLGSPLPTGSFVAKLEFSPDGRRLGVGTQGGDSLLFDVATGTQVTSLPGTSVVSSLSFSPDGTRLATLTDTAQIWDAATFEPIGPPIDPQVGPSVGTFIADGALAIGGFAGIVSLWEPDGHARIAEPIPGSPPGGGVFSPNGQAVAVPAFDAVSVYSTETLRPIGPALPVPPGPPVDGVPFPGLVAISRDGVVAVSGRDRTIQRYDVATLDPIGGPVVVDAPPTTLAFSPDGDVLAAGTSDDTVTLVDARTGTASRPEPLGLAGFVFVTFSPDGRRLVVGTGAGAGVIFDVTEEPLALRRAAGPLTGVVGSAFSPDGRVAVTGSLSGTVQFRDARTFAPLGAPVASNDGAVYQLAFSPDGSLLVAGDAGRPGSARLVDVASRQPVGDAFVGQSGALSFSPDGTRLAMPSSTTTLLWDLDTTTWRERACEIAGRNLTAAEVRRYLPDGADAKPTCSRFPGP
jgi:WD40 repeat protein/DNA-binding SARP family transcriptional activator